MSHAVKIVMVEDDLGHAKLIEKNIRRANISNDIEHFADGSSALEYLFSEDMSLNGPMLILLDLNLPDMSGTDILTRVKSDERLKRAPVVILTTTDDKHEIQRWSAQLLAILAVRLRVHGAPHDSRPLMVPRKGTSGNTSRIRSALSRVMTVSALAMIK